MINPNIQLAQFQGQEWTGFHGTDLASARAIENRVRQGKRGLLPSTHGDLGAGVYVASPDARLNLEHELNDDERAEMADEMKDDALSMARTYSTFSAPDEPSGTHPGAVVHVTVDPEKIIHHDDFSGTLVHPNGVTVRKIEYPTHSILFSRKPQEDIGEGEHAPVTRGK